MKIIKKYLDNLENKFNTLKEEYEKIIIRN